METDGGKPGPIANFTTTIPRFAPQCYRPNAVYQPLPRVHTAGCQMDNIAPRQVDNNAPPLPPPASLQGRSGSNSPTLLILPPSLMYHWFQMLPPRPPASVTPVKHDTSVPATATMLPIHTAGSALLASTRGHPLPHSIHNNTYHA